MSSLTLDLRMLMGFIEQASWLKGGRNLNIQ